MELSIPVEGVHGEVIERTLIIRFNRTMKTLSSAMVLQLISFMPS